MKDSGIIRYTDELSRVVIPKEMRDKLQMKVKSYVVMYQRGKEVVITKYDDSCIFCGKKTGLIDYEDKFICKKCLAEIKSKYK